MNRTLKKVISVILCIAMVSGLILTPLGAVFGIKPHVAQAASEPSVASGATTSGYVILTSSIDKNGDEYDIKELADQPARFDYAIGELHNGLLDGVTVKFDSCLNALVAAPTRGMYANYTAVASVKTENGVRTTTWTIQAGISSNPIYGGCKWAWKDYSGTISNSPGYWGNYQTIQGIYDYSKDLPGYITLNKGFYATQAGEYTRGDHSPYDGQIHASINGASGTMIYALSDETHAKVDNINRTITQYMVKRAGQTAYDSSPYSSVSNYAYSLKGAEFTVWKDRINYQSSTPVARITTDVHGLTQAGNYGTVSSYDGTSYTYSLDAGNYVISETKTPRGWTTVSDTKFTLRKGETKVFGAPNSADGAEKNAMMNRSLNVDITVKKAASGSSYPDTKMKGAYFILYYKPSGFPLSSVSRNSDRMSVSVTKNTGAWEFATFEVNSSGKAIVKEVCEISRTGMSAKYSPTGVGTETLTNCPAGYYCLVEVKPATGYQIPAVPYWNYSLTSGSRSSTTKVQNEKRSSKEFNVTETKAYSFVVNKAVSSSYAQLVSSFPNAYSLEGAVYVLKSGDTTVATFKTDSGGAGKISGSVAGSWSYTSAGKKYTGNFTKESDYIVGNIPYNHSFTLEETTAPASFVKTSNAMNVTVTQSPTVKTDSETPKYIDFTVTKEGEGNYNKLHLAGAEFELYYKSTKTPELTVVTAEDQMSRTITDVKSGTVLIGKFKVNASGNVECTEVKTVNGYTATKGTNHINKLPLGYYTLVETKAPTYYDEYQGDKTGIVRYKVSSKERFDINLSSTSELVKNTTVAQVPYEQKVVDKDNTPSFATFEMQKISENPEITEDNDCYDMSGAEYIVYGWYNATTKKFASSKTESESEGFRKRNLVRFISDTDGNLTIKSQNYSADGGYAEFDDYIISNKGDSVFKLNIGQSTKIYLGYSEDVAPINGSFAVTTSGDNTIIVKAGDEITKQVYETPVNDPINIKITKKNAENGSSDGLDGTVFEVDYYKTYLYNEAELKDAVADRTWYYAIKDGVIHCNDEDYLIKTGTYKSDKLYMDEETEEYIIPLGTLVIKEVKAAGKFSLDGTALVDNNDNGLGKNLYIAHVVPDPNNEGRGLTVSADIHKQANEDPSNRTRILSAENEITELGRGDDRLRGDFTFNKTGMKRVSNDSDEITYEPLGNVHFRVDYYGETKADSSYGTDVLESIEIVTEEDGSFTTKDNPDFYIYGETDESLFAQIRTYIDENGLGHCIPGKYILTELRCEANVGYVLMSPIEFFVEKDNTQIVSNVLPKNLGEVTNILEPELSTLQWDKEFAYNHDVNTHMSVADGSVTIVDEVTYKYLDAAEDYTVKGILMDISGDTPKIFKDADGKIVTANGFIEASHYDITTEMQYDISQDGKIVQLSSSSQYGWVGGDWLALDCYVKSNGSSTEYSTWANYFQAGGTGKIQPAIDYIEGHISEFDFNQNGSIDAEDVDIFEAMFGGKKGGIRNGKIEVEFPSFNAEGYEGKIFTVYEYLFNGKTETLLKESDLAHMTDLEDAYILSTGKVAGHYDATDIKQTGYFPDASTTEWDASSETKMSLREHSNGVVGDDWVVVCDKLEYKNLEPSLTYIVDVKVRNAVDGTEVGGTSVILWSADTDMQNVYKVDVSGSGDIIIDDIEFDAVDIDSFYICEEIKYGEETVVSHTQKVESQTGYVPRMSTTALGKSPAPYLDTHTIVASPTAEIEDTVQMKNLIVDEGLKYTMVGYLVDKKTAKIISKANKSLNPKPNDVNANGILTDKMTFVFDSTDYIGKDIVVLEYLYVGEITNTYGTVGSVFDFDEDDEFDTEGQPTNANNNNGIHSVSYDKLIARHASLNDANQTITVMSVVINFIKYDNFGNPLKGAKMAVINKDTNEKVEEWTTDGTDKPHQMFVKDIPANYIFVEEESPAGYSVGQPVEFNVTTDGKVFYSNGHEVSKDSTQTYIITMNNVVLSGLPTTGGIGVLPYILLGMMFISVSMLILIGKKEKTY